MFLYFVFFLNFCLNFFFNFYLKFFFSKIFLLKLFCWNFFCWNFFLQNFFLNFLFGHFFFFRPLGSSVQKCQSRGVPNDLTDVRSKNVTHMGSRMTFGMFGPSITWLKRGPERPFRFWCTLLYTHPRNWFLSTPYSLLNSARRAQSINQSFICQSNPLGFSNQQRLLR